MSVLEHPAPDTYQVYDKDGRAWIRKKLGQLSDEMAQVLIAHCMAMELDELRVMVETAPVVFHEWERDQCEHELMIMRNILSYRMDA